MIINAAICVIFMLAAVAVFLGFAIDNPKVIVTSFISSLVCIVALAIFSVLTESPAMQQVENLKQKAVEAGLAEYENEKKQEDFRWLNLRIKAEER